MRVSQAHFTTDQRYLLEPCGMISAWSFVQVHICVHTHTHVHTLLRGCTMEETCSVNIL